jgi:hypothetical protein
MWDLIARLWSKISQEPVGALGLLVSVATFIRTDRREARKWKLEEAPHLVLSADEVADGYVWMRVVNAHKCIARVSAKLPAILADGTQTELVDEGDFAGEAEISFGQVHFIKLYPPNVATLTKLSVVDSLGKTWAMSEQELSKLRAMAKEQMKRVREESGLAEIAKENETGEAVWSRENKAKGERS